MYPFGYESSLSSLKMHIWDSHFQDSNEVERVRSMPDYVVSSEKGLKLVEVKFRKRSDREGHPGVYMKNTDLNRYRRYWAESLIALISPFGDRFFCQDVNNLIPGSQDTKWFDYHDFQSLREVYPETRDKLKAFGVAVDKLGSLWDETNRIIEPILSGITSYQPSSISDALARDTEPDAKRHMFSDTKT